MIRSTIPILLPILLIFQMLFSYLSFETGRSQCHFNFLNTKDVIDDELTFTLTFTNDYKIQWIDKNQEFVFNEKLYDVISIEHTDSTTILKCVGDLMETGIINAFYNSIETNEKRESKNNLILKFNEIVYIISETSFSFNLIKTNLSLITTNQNIPSTVYLQLISPPPEDYLFSLSSSKV